MIELNDNEILEYLMNSEFNENYRPEEYKFLLHKFRYFYRMLYGNHTRIKDSLEFENTNLRHNIDSISKENININIKISELRDIIDLSNKPRKLTFKERFLGKINKY